MKTFDNTNGYFQGVFRYFGLEYSNEVTNYVKVTSSSTFQSYPDSIVLGDGLSSFATKYDKPQWVIIELKKSLLSLTSYTINSIYNPHNDWPHLRNWDLYGSIDGCEWELVDRRENCNDLNGEGIYANFECNIKVNGVYRFLKIQQTGTGFNGVYGFGIYKMDLFGILFESEYVPKCKYQTIK